MKKILSFIVMMVFVLSIVGAAYAEGNDTNVGSNNSTTSTGTNNSTTSTCVIKEGKCCLGDICSTSSANCVQGTTPKFLGCDAACVAKVECVKPDVNNTITCVREGNSYPVGTTPGSPTYTCCSGLVPYSPPGLVGGVKCVKPNSTNTITCKPVDKACTANTRQVIFKDKDGCEQIRCEGLEGPESNDDEGRSGNDNKATPVSGRIPQGVAVGQKCDISEEYKNAGEALKEEYKNALESKKLDAAKVAREKMQELEQKIMDQRRACMTLNVPGLIKEDKKECLIPKDLADKMEALRAKVDTLRSQNVSIPSDVKNQISDLESKASDVRAKCNALKFSDQAKEGDVAAIYTARLKEAMSNNDSDTKIQTLKELRKEIDETIKNLIEQKKKLKFSDMEGVADKVRLRPKTIDVGDSSTSSEDVEIETEIEGSEVTLSSTSTDVILSQDGLNVTATDLTVDSDGLSVEGVAVKISPTAMLNKNQNLDRNRARVTEMKLEKEGEKAVYNTKYDAKKKVLGFIPATAKQEMKIDASNGQLVSEKKPWWGFIASDVKEANTTTE
jgi:D-aminopeptidase